MTATLAYRCDWCEEPAVLRLSTQCLQPEEHWVAPYVAPPFKAIDVCVTHLGQLRVTGGKQVSGGLWSLDWKTVSE